MSRETMLRVIDSHTEGEPTRVVVEGGPDLGSGSLAEKKERLAAEHDWLRTACVSEPRGHDAMVGAMLCETTEPDCATGVIFFNNVGCLHSCVHGTIGVTVTLAYLGRLFPGVHRIETPVGVVEVQLHEHGRVTVANVPSYRHAKGVKVDVPDWGLVRGDVAWGGNWFYLIKEQGPEVEIENIEALTEFSWAVRKELKKSGVTGKDGGEIDHIEVFGPPADPKLADSRNFVLCPGKEYDRSPCGTGTSAKLACLHADGELVAGEVWRQASILNTVFEGSVEPLEDGLVIPRVTGSGWINGDATLILNPDDPFRFGIS
ncbi:MAG: proline racemase family protein [Akkermansiaceae bacterium]